jgi:threonine dehydrogenase-like Zn-dependent dehydrogenase
MQAAHVTAPGTVRVDSFADPEPAAGHAVVRPELISICGSDLLAVYGQPADAYPLNPGQSGHEVIGVVEAVEYRGKTVFPFEPGERVLATPSPHVGMAERFAIGLDALVRVPEGVPAERLAIAQPLGTVICGCNKLRDVAGATVAVVGQGGIGLLFDRMLRRMGAGTVIGLDPVEARRAAGLRFGADHVIDAAGDDVPAAVAEASGGVEPQIVIEAAGEPASINLAVELVRPFGQLLLFGVPKQPAFELSYLTWFRKRPHTQSSSIRDGTGSAPYELALNLIARGDVDVEGLISHRLPLARVADAYELARTRGDGALKVAVDFREGEGARTA